MHRGDVVVTRETGKAVPLFEDAFVMERDLSVPDDALPTPSSLARRVMFRGDWFEINELAAAIGKPNKSGQSLVYQTMSVMKRLGFQFEKRPAGGRGGPVRLRLTNPSHQPSRQKLEGHRKAAPNGAAASKATRNFKVKEAEADERRRKDRERKRRQRAALSAGSVPERVPPGEVVLVRPGDDVLPQVDEGSLVARLARGADPFRR